MFLLYKLLDINYSDYEVMYYKMADLGSAILTYGYIHTASMVNLYIHVFAYTVPAKLTLLYEDLYLQIATDNV